MVRINRAWLHPGWSWTVRYPRIVVFGYSAGSLLLGLGISALVSLAPGGLTSSQVRRLQWLMFVAFGLAVVVYAVSEIARQGRDRMRKQNGIAYIVRERARAWQRDESDEFTGGLERRFERVIEVPGPGQLGPGWDWPLDEDARHWDEKAEELARSFRTLYLASESPGTATAIFAYAWWSVAVALCARLTAADRSLELAVGQRPSNARSGKVDPDLWVHVPQSFTYPAPGPDVLASPGSGEFTYPARLTATGGRGETVHAGNDVSILLVRVGTREWGPVPAVGEDRREVRGPVRVLDRAGVGLSRTSEVQLHELRCLPPPGEKQIAWEAFPALAMACADWIVNKAAELAGHTLLLGAIMPPEIALGLGICAGQVKRVRWPAHLWPLMYQGQADPFVMPYLDLGTARLPGRG
jgi:hypothetical protein